MSKTPCIQCQTIDEIKLAISYLRAIGHDDCWSEKSLIAFALQHMISNVNNFKIYTVGTNNNNERIGFDREIRSNDLVLVLPENTIIDDQLKTMVALGLNPYVEIENV